MERICFVDRTCFVERLCFIVVEVILTKSESLTKQMPLSASTLEERYFHSRVQTSDPGSDETPLGQTSDTGIEETHSSQTSDPGIDEMLQLCVGISRSILSHRRVL